MRVYRTDEELSAAEPDSRPFPARFHQAITARIAQDLPGLSITFSPQRATSSATTNVTLLRPPSPLCGSALAPRCYRLGHRQNRIARPAGRQTCFIPEAEYRWSIHPTRGIRQIAGCSSACGLQRPNSSYTRSSAWCGSCGRVTVILSPGRITPDCSTIAIIPALRITRPLSSCPTIVFKSPGSNALI